MAESDFASLRALFFILREAAGAESSLTARAIPSRDRKDAPCKESQEIIGELSVRKS